MSCHPIAAVPTEAELDRLADMLGLPPLPSGPALDPHEVARAKRLAREVVAATLHRAHPAGEQCRCRLVGPRPAHRPTACRCCLVAL